MNDLELESRLKAIPLPVRTDKYWEQFPSSVRRQLRSALVMPPQATFARWLVWSSAPALACLILAAALWSTVEVMAKDARLFRHQLVRLPAQLRVLMADEHGMHYLVADKP